MSSFSEDSILQGLRSGGPHRPTYEKELYKSFFYFIKEAQVKYGLIEEDAASAYSDTIIVIIHNIIVVPRILSPFTITCLWCQ